MDEYVIPQRRAACVSSKRSAPVEINDIRDKKRRRRNPDDVADGNQSEVYTNDPN
jgi:hypothetical protein